VKHTFPRLALPMVLTLFTVGAFGLNGSAPAPPPVSTSARAPTSPSTSTDFTQYVDTRIGTASWEGVPLALAAGELPWGKTYPQTGRPFAHTGWTPNTTGNGQWTPPYIYTDKKITGFLGSNYPSGASVNDSGFVEVGAYIGAPSLRRADRASPFSHGDEIAKPYFYSVHLSRFGITATLTASKNVACMEFTYPATPDGVIVIDCAPGGPQSSGYVKIDPDNRRILGKNCSVVGGDYHTYFAMEFEKDFTECGTINGKRVNANGAAESGEAHLGAYFRFAATRNERVKVKIATSHISAAQALTNLNAQVPGWDFDAVKVATKGIWNDKLGRIEIEGATARQKRIFYTALWHCYLAPRDLTEDVGVYRSPYDGKVHGSGAAFTNYSLWDTFRALHPLMNIIDTAQSEEFVKGLLNAYDEGGWMPKWPLPGYANIMYGTHADSVVADAYIKGIRGYDAGKALEAMLKNATTVGSNGFAGRAGILDYIQCGFVPNDKCGESVARTVEFAYDDYCIAQMAKAQGHTETYRKYMRRATYYRNVMDPHAKLVRGRNADGSWLDPEDTSISGWATGITLRGYRMNHTVFTPHDVKWLIKFMGGNEPFIGFLDTFFGDGGRGHYYVGDEHSMHAPYLYNYAGAPHKTQKIIHDIREKYFRDSAGGLPGNDDCGQVSAWYIFGALGFYPVCPGTPRYVIGTPLFKKATIHLPNGKDFVIAAPTVSPSNFYIQSIALNGVSYGKNWFTHEDITRGGALEVTMTSKPTSWATDPDACPPSMTDLGLPSPPPPQAPVVTPPRTANLALGKPVTVSSIWGGSFAGSNAVDGNTATRWCSSPSSKAQWICVDLGSRRDIRQVRLNWEQASASSYKIQVSDDANSWTDIYSTTTGNAGIDHITGLSARGRYVRMYETNTGTSCYSLWEFEVY